MKLITSPYQLGSLHLKNRLVLPPMATSKTENGKVTQEILEYYQDKTKHGKLGLVIMEHSYVSIEGQASRHQLSISSDEDVIGLSGLVDLLHTNDSKVFAQINHAGMKAKQEVSGYPPLAPSALRYPQDDIAPLPQEMTQRDIEKVISEFTNAALRAKQAGFDGVELHASHGYLLNQFYSPITNKRSDEFGGDVCGRILIIKNIIREVKKLVGETFCLGVRLGACDYIEQGNTIEDAVTASILLEKEGIQFLHISGGLRGYLRPNHQEAGYFQDVSEAIKHHVQIPVILTGGICKGLEAETLLKEGKADLIGVGRAILKDSDWPIKELQ